LVTFGHRHLRGLRQLGQWFGYGFFSYDLGLADRGQLDDRHGGQIRPGHNLPDRGIEQIARIEATYQKDKEKYSNKQLEPERSFLASFWPLSITNR
jgi:hypothetical protein